MGSLCDNQRNQLLPITVGLDNTGGICYMNAILQCFSNIEELSKFFLNKFKISKNDQHKRLSNEYCKVIQNLWNRKKNGKLYSPLSFKKVIYELNPSFSLVTGNGPIDLINFLLERLQQELNVAGNNNNINKNLLNKFNQLNENAMLNFFFDDFIKRYKSIITNLFYGVIETKTQCTNCCRIKYNFQIFTYLDFPLQQVNQYCFQTGKRMNFFLGIPYVDLYECFEHYQSLINMTGINQIYCSECGRACNALYGTFLFSMPNYLIINLNRTNCGICVNFPETLKLHNYVIKKEINTIFNLIAVICRTDSGNFIAYCRHHTDHNWYKYNDANVAKCLNPKEYLNGTPYILFYKVVDNTNKCY